MVFFSFLFEAQRNSVLGSPYCILECSTVIRYFPRPSMPSNWSWLRELVELRLRRVARVVAVPTPRVEDRALAEFGIRLGLPAVKPGQARSADVSDQDTT